MSDRDLSTSTTQVFGDVQKGTTCRVCGRDVDDGRAKFCSQYCRRLAKAVMSMVNWGGVRRLVKNRDDQTCQQCGYDQEREKLARRHIRDLVESKLPERPKGPSALALGDGEEEDFDWDRHFDELEEWNAKQDALEERYGDRYGTPRHLEVDHITPISEGGHPFDPGNLQTLCTECHKDKTASEAADRAERRRTMSKQELNESLFEYVSGECEPPEVEAEIDG